MAKRSQNACALALLFCALPAFAASTKINKVTYGDKPAGAQNSKDALAPEQALRLKKLFLFPSIDDLSGALAPKLDEKLAELFNRNTRFELIRDSQVVKALSPDESAYPKAAVNATVHKEAAKVVGADTTVLLRTRNLGPNTQMTLELRDANGDLLFAEEGSVPGIAKLDARWTLIENLYKKILSKLPFEGAVTGRTANTLTIDLGIGMIKQGDEVETARVVSLQRHPLLGTVIGTDYVRTGRARVTTVDKVLSFAEVAEEITSEKIAPGQKILLAHATISRKTGEEPESSDNQAKPIGRKRYDEETGRKRGEEDPLEDRVKGDFDRPKARFGHIGGSLLYGSVSQTQTFNGTAGEFSGSGIGGEFDGELWVTKSWITNLSYGMHSANLSGSQGTQIGASSFKRFSFLVGYRIHPEAMAEGIALTGSIGYQSMSFDIPENTTLTVGGKKYRGPILRADGEINFLEGQRVTVGFGIQPFVNFTETGGSLGSPDGATVIGMNVAWNKQLMPEVWLRIGMRYDVANGNYTAGNSVSNKRFAIGPGIYYLF